MKKTMMVIFVLSVALFLAGCGGEKTSASEETPTEIVPGEESETAPTAGLGSAPPSYCMTYTLAVGAPGVPPTTLKYCQEPGKARTTVEQIGFTIDSFCDGGKGTVCTAAGSDPVCAPDTNACSSIQEPFQGLDVSSNSAFYHQLPDRTIAGLSAKCYTLDVQRAGKLSGQDVPDTMRYATLCYHPQYKMMLYYDYIGTKHEVTAFSTPAPAGTFTLPG